MMVLYEKDGQRIFDDVLLTYLSIKESSEVLSMIENLDVKDLADSSGMTLLHYAASAGDDVTAKYLIDQGCDVDAQNNDGQTPLLLLIDREIYPFESYLPVISILLESNADILLCKQGQKNPLQKVLSPVGAPVFLEPDNELCAMFYESLKRRCSNDFRQIVKILLDTKLTFPRIMYFQDPILTTYMLNNEGCTVHDRDLENGQTALHYAVDMLNNQMVKLLLEYGANISAENFEGCTPLDLYIPGQEGGDEVLTTLLNHHPTLDPFKLRDSEIIACVLRCGRVRDIEALLKYDFDLNVPLVDGQFFLHLIAENKNCDVMKLLEDRNFNVNVKYNERKTALSYAIENLNASSLKFLFKHGISPNIWEMDEIFKQIFRTSASWKGNIKARLKCVELIWEHIADLHDYVCIYLETLENILDEPSNFQFLILMKPLIAYLVMMEAKGQYIEELEMLRKETHKNYLNLCRRKVDKLKKTVINEKFTLFHFLTESENELFTCARNYKAQLEQIYRRERRSNIFFVKLLRKRIHNALKPVKLREEAAVSISRISGIGNQDVIDKIISLLDKKSMQNLCQV